MTQTISRLALRYVVPYAVVLALYPLPAHAGNLDDFRHCIGLGGTGSTCTLDPNPDGWPISTPLEVQRSNITIVGAITYARYQVTLRRTTTLGAQPIMHLAPSVSNVTIRDLFFDGNRGQIGSLPWYLADDYIDLDLNADEGTSNVTVSADFMDSPGFSMTLAGSDTTVEYCNFWYGRISAIWGGSTAGYFDIYNNDFFSYGTGAVGLCGAHHGYVRWNYFSGNHDEFVYGYPGGQLFIDRPSTYVWVWDNWFYGSWVQQGDLWTSAIEAYADYLDIRRNEATQHTGPGMYFTGVRHLTVAQDWSSYKIELNNRRSFVRTFDGISIENYPGYPYSEDITIDGIIAIDGHEYGISISTRDYGTITGVRVRNNCCLSGNLLGGLYTSPNVYFAEPPSYRTSGCP